MPAATPDTPGATMAESVPATTGEMPDEAKGAAGVVLPAEGSVTMFTTVWCGYCNRLKGQLTRAGVPFTEIDLEASPEHLDFVESVNGGNRTVPTLVFPDGGSATNPSLAQVQERLAG
jgi:mycoredoxin